jgi:D-inositol-3-phosphate glycosyltransferase
MSVYVREVSRCLGAAGHRVDIFTYGTKASTVQLYLNVRLIQLRTRGAGLSKEQLAGHLPQIFEALEKYRLSQGLIYDLIHSHYWISGVVGAMAQARWCTPHLTMFHTLGVVKNHTGSGENESERRIAHERWLAKVADHIVAPSRLERQNLWRFYHAPADRVGIIPCGVDLAHFRPMDREAARRRLGIARDADVALFVGRFARLKGLDNLIAAIALLSARFPRLQLLVIGGDGPRASSTRDLQQVAEKLKIGDRVRFVGRVEQEYLPPYYAAADLLALPSYYESFGLVVLEALACGIPVVGTPVGAVETIVTDGLNGSVIASAKADEIARGMARILSRPPQRRMRGEAMRATVSDYGWPRIAEAVARTYELLLRGHDPALAPEFYSAINIYSN